MFSTQFIRLTDKDLNSDTVADGNYDFVIPEHGPPNNLIEYFHFVDGGGNITSASAGNVVITFSSGADIFQDIPSGSFTAITAESASRSKPNGYGKVVKVRINLSGVTGASGFRAKLTQNA